MPVSISTATSSAGQEENLLPPTFDLIDSPRPYPLDSFDFLYQIVSLFEYHRIGSYFLSTVGIESDIIPLPKHMRPGQIWNDLATCRNEIAYPQNAE